MFFICCWSCRKTKHSGLRSPGLSGPRAAFPARLCSGVRSRLKNHNYVKHLSYSEVGRLSETSRLESDQPCRLHTVTFLPVHAHPSWPNKELTKERWWNGCPVQKTFLKQHFISSLVASKPWRRWLKLPVLVVSQSQSSLLRRQDGGTVTQKGFLTALSKTNVWKQM